MTDYRLKKCPICQHFWCFIKDDMCCECKARGYVIESKPIENPIGITQSEQIEIVQKVKKHD